MYGVAFQSLAFNLTTDSVSGNSRNVFVRFPTLNINALISKTSLGQEGNGLSTAPAIAVTASTTTVAFLSTAEDLVGGDTNKKADVFLTTFKTPKRGESITPGTIKRISVAADGTEGDGDCETPRISGDGAYVTFVCASTNLVTGGTPDGIRQVYLYKVADGTLTLVSKGASGTPGARDSADPRLSFSGRYLVYKSAATEITGSATNRVRIALFDRQDGGTTIIDTTTSGVEPDGNAASPSISPDGRLVGFASAATNLISSDLNGLTDTFIKDLSLGTLQRSSIPLSGGESDGASDLPAIALNGYSGTAGTIAMRSTATNLTAIVASPIQKVLNNGFSLPLAAVTNDTALEVPPDLPFR